MAKKNKVLNLTANELGRLFSGGSSPTNVNDSTALNYAPVFACVNLISNDIGKQTLKIWKRLEKGKELDEKHQAYLLVKSYPSDYVSAKRFWTDFTFHYLFWGNSYAWIDRSANGRIKALYNLRPDVTCWDSKDGLYKSEIGTGDQAKEVHFRRDDILHCRNFANPGQNEPSLLKNAKESWGIGLSAQGHTLKFFDAACNVGGVLSIPSATPKDKRKNIIEGWDKQHKNEAFKVAILTDGVQFHRVALNAEESQFDQTRIHQAREVANWFNVPISKLSLPDSGGYGSRTEDNRNYLEQTLTPILCEFASECNVKLLTKQQKKADSHFFQHDTKDLSRPDGKTQAEVHKLYAEIGVMNSNECREEIGKNPREGGDAYFEPNANHKLEGSDQESGSDAESHSGTDAESQDIQDMLQVSLNKWQQKTENTINRQRERKEPARFSKWLAEFKPDDFEFRDLAEKHGLTVPSLESIKCL